MSKTKNNFGKYILALGCIFIGSIIIFPQKASKGHQEVWAFGEVPFESKNLIEKINVYDYPHITHLIIYFKQTAQIKDKYNINIKLFGEFELLEKDSSNLGILAKAKQLENYTEITLELNPEKIKKLSSSSLQLKDKTERKLDFYTERKFINIDNNNNFPIEYNWSLNPTYPRTIFGVQPETTQSAIKWKDVTKLTRTYVDFIVPFKRELKQILNIISTILISIGASYLVTIFHENMNENKELIRSEENENSNRMIVKRKGKNTFEVTHIEDV